MNWADWVIVAILGVSSVFGIMRGFVKEALSLAGWVLAFVIALTFHQQLAQLLGDWIESVSVRYTVAFGLLFAATLVVSAMVTYLISEVVRRTGLSGTDRTFGAVFGLARGLIMVLALVIILPMLIPFDQEKWWQESLLIPQLQMLEDWSRNTFAVIAGWFRELFAVGAVAVDKFT